MQNDHRYIQEDQNTLEKPKSGSKVHKKIEKY